MALFAVADVHGYFDEMQEALKGAGFFDSRENKLIVLGDALDRGNQAREVVDFLLGLQREGRLIYIYGNHEELLYKCLQDVASGYAMRIAWGMSHHYSNGTWGTLLQLSEMSENDAVAHPNVLIERIKATPYYRELLPTAVNFYETERYVFCHGWLPVIRKEEDGVPTFEYDKNWREADEREWHTARWSNGMEMACMHGGAVPEKTVVCGHWNASWGHAHISGVCNEYGTDAICAPFYAEGIIALDACTARSGKVNCVVFEE